MKTIESEEIMLQVGSALVSLDVIERFFANMISKMFGGIFASREINPALQSPKKNVVNWKEILPVIWDDLLPEEVRYRTARSCLCR